MAPPIFWLFDAKYIPLRQEAPTIRFYQYYTLFQRILQCAEQENDHKMTIFW